MKKCKLCGSAEHDELNHNGLVDERLEELAYALKGIAERQKQINPEAAALLEEHLWDLI